jgi:hypothetical protein
MIHNARPPVTSAAPRPCPARRARPWLPLVLTACAAATAAAQDTHYWTNQYGDRATLLGGAVVGSAVDLSAVYYNPGALSLIESPDLIAATKVFEWARVTAEGGGDIGAKLGDNRLGLAPGFFAGLLPFRFLRDDRLSYSLFTRYNFDATLRTVGTGQDDILPIPEGIEDFYGSLEFTGKLSETWVGLTWSRPFANIGVGVSNFLAVRSERGGREVLAEAYSPAGAAAISVDREAYEYFNYRVLWKVGVAGEWQGWSIGVTLTTPSISLFGSGQAELNRTVFGQDTDGDGVADPVFAADFQDGLGAQYRSPFSAAVGASRRFGATRLHLTGEWFAPVGTSVVLDPEPFEAQSSGDTLASTVTQSLQAVLNLGAGIEHHFGPRTALYGSVRTDQSGRLPGPSSDVGITSWDIYFLSAGARFQAAGADFTLGVGYGFGSQAVPLNPNDDDVGDPLPAELRVRYRNYRLIFAFAF